MHSKIISVAALFICRVFRTGVLLFPLERGICVASNLFAFRLIRLENPQSSVVHSHLGMLCSMSTGRRPPRPCTVNAGGIKELEQSKLAY